MDLFTLEGFVATEQFGVDLREFFQLFPKLLIGRHPVLAVLLLGGGFEEKLQDVSLSQTAHQIVKGAVPLSLGASAVGFTAGGEPFDIGGPKQIRGNGQTAPQSRFALAQRQGRGAAELVYLSQLLGEDNSASLVWQGKRKWLSTTVQCESAQLIENKTATKQAQEYLRNRCKIFFGRVGWG